MSRTVWLQGSGARRLPPVTQPAGTVSLYVVVGEAHVEFAIAHVLIGFPAAEVVVHGKLRVPVGDKKHFAVAAHTRVRRVQGW